MNGKKQIGTVLLTMVLLISMMIGVQALNILETEISASGINGILTLPFTVNNTDPNASINVTFSATLIANQNGTLNISLPAPIINLSPNQSIVVNLLANITNATAGNYTGTVTANDGTTQDTANVVIQVQSNGLTLMRVGSGTLSVTGNAGQSVTGSFIIKNLRNSRVVATVTPVPGFGTHAGVTQTFAPFEEKSVSFSVNIPTNTQPGTFTGTVRVSVEGSTVLSELLQTHVNPTASIGVTGNIKVVESLGATRTTSFVITNNGNQELDDLVISFTAANFQDDDGDQITVAFTPNNDIDLLSGASRTVSVRTDVPTDMDSGIYTGVITIINNQASRTFTLEVEIENILRISEVDVEVEGTSSRSRIAAGETITVEVEVENIATNIDLEEVEVEVYFEDSAGRRLEDDDGDDLQDDAQLDDLDAGDDDRETFTFVMPFDIDDGDRFNVVVEARARNLNERSQTFFAKDNTEELSADVEDNDIQIVRANFDRASLSCDRFTNLEVTVRNVGDSNEDVELTVSNSALRYRETRTFELDRDDRDPDFEVDSVFPISISSAQTGTYEFSIVAEYNNNRRSKSSKTILNVQQCGTGQRDNQDQDNQDQNNEDREPFNPDTRGRVPFDSRSEPVDLQFDNAPAGNAANPQFTLQQADGKGNEETMLMILLLLANIVVLTLVVLGAVKLSRRM